MNRLKEYFQDPEPESPEGDFWVVESRWDTFHVSRETVQAVERALDRFWRPRWVVFTDLFGARRRVLTRTIDRVSECTSAQRTAIREFERARRLEEKADRRPWEED